MTGENITKAAQEAKRFLKAVDALRKSATDASITGTKESGALRRASLDLTRALAEMRRPS